MTYNDYILKIPTVCRTKHIVRKDLCMKRCIIITGYIEGSIASICPELLSPLSPGEKPPLILCADGGYRLAKAEGLLPHVIIGDFDTFDDQSGEQPGVCDSAYGRGTVIRVPVMKDDSDTMLCIKYGLDQGCDSFLLIGGIGGRLDHTVANLQSLAYLASRGADACMKDGENCIMMKAPGSFSLFRCGGDDPDDTSRPYRRFSLFSWTPSCEGIFVSGAKYPLENGRLEFTFPLGVSNEFIDREARIRFQSGMMLVILNRHR